MAQKKKRIQKRKITVPKSCYYCKGNKTPWYSEVTDLQKFVSDRGKIITRARTGLCTKHQRRITSAIKHARHLALMPFVTGE